MCYHAQFCRSSLKSVVIDRGEPQNWGALGLHPFGTGAWLTPKNKLPLMCYHVKLVVHRQRGTHRYKGTPKIGER